MPEGDSLHRAAQLLHPKLVGERVRSLELVRSSTRTEGLAGTTVHAVEARGKNLLVHFQAPYSLHVHLKMNGRIRLYARDDPTPVARSRVSAVLETEGHRVVVYSAPIARLLRTSDLERDLRFRGLGPDLLAPHFDPNDAVERLRCRAPTPLGEAIIDQSVVAGIGNVWKSELCFNLRLDPFAPVCRFADEELAGLVSLARAQLHDNVCGPKRSAPDPFAPRAFRQTRLGRRQGESVLSVYERAGQPCYDCATIIEMKRQGEQRRATYYCPSCQPPRGDG